MYEKDFTVQPAFVCIDMSHIITDLNMGQAVNKNFIPSQSWCIEEPSGLSLTHQRPTSAQTCAAVQSLFTNKLIHLMDVVNTPDCLGKVVKPCQQISTGG